MTLNLQGQSKPLWDEKRIVGSLIGVRTPRLLAVFNPNISPGARNAAILTVSLDCGQRFSEAINPIDEDAKLSEGFVKVMGRGGRSI